MNYKLGFFVLLAIVVLTNLFWLVQLLDRSIAADHAQQEHRYQSKDLDLLRQLTIDLAACSDKAAFSKLLKSKYANRIVKEEDGLLFVDGVGFGFEGERLSQIRFMSEPPS